MPFSDFHGNAEAVLTLREMLAHDHFPHAVILSGPQGAGKFTLAQMVAKTMNCLERPVTDGLPDFCGQCSNCVRIAEADALEERFAEAVEARENLRDSDKRETRIFIQTHADVLIIPPDPPQMLVKVDQVRHVIAEIYYRPEKGGERVSIFSHADFMKEAANSLLKVLEEPPDFATIFLLTDNPSALLPTIRSRCMHLRLVPLPAAEVEEYLARVRPEWQARERSLVARVCGGGLGRARTFDLASYVSARQDALALLGPAMGSQDYSGLFRITETYRAGGEGKSKIEHTIRTLYLLLEDLLFLKSYTPDLVRNRDIETELTKAALRVDFAWIVRTAQRLGEVETGMRRNLLRSLSLDSFATSLET
jgi:DNA polymerase-3 subunit delta'